MQFIVLCLYGFPVVIGSGVYGFVYDEEVDLVLTFREKYEGVVSMDGFHDKSRDRIERFVRSENVARFGRLLAIEQDESECKILSELISQEREKQRKAGDY